MRMIATEIDDLLLFEPEVYTDDRGYFFETFNTSKYPLPSGTHFVQDNEAKSDKGVLRGLHFQTGQHAQGKLVRVITGSVYDIAVDIRPDSPTFGEAFGVLLSGDNKKQMWVPRGFAHGYLVLEDNTLFAYKCDNYYNKAAEGGIRFDDPDLSISWPEIDVPFIISEKDLNLGSFASMLI